MDYHTSSKRNFIVRSNLTIPAIDELWRQYSKRLAPTPPFQLINELVAVLANEFDDFKEWLYANHQHVCQDTENRAFLRDCIIFTQTGQRSLSTAAWGEMLKHKGDFTNVNFSDVYIPTTEELLSDWVKSESGVRDLFESAFLMFGTGE